MLSWKIYGNCHDLKINGQFLIRSEYVRILPHTHHYTTELDNCKGGPLQFFPNCLDKFLLKFIYQYNTGSEGSDEPPFVKEKLLVALVSLYKAVKVF